MYFDESGIEIVKSYIKNGRNYIDDAIEKLYASMRQDPEKPNFSSWRSVLSQLSNLDLDLESFVKNYGFTEAGVESFINFWFTNKCLSDYSDLEEVKTWIDNYLDYKELGVSKKDVGKIISVLLQDKSMNVDQFNKIMFNILPDVSDPVKTVKNLLMKCCHGKAKRLMSCFPIPWQEMETMELIRDVQEIFFRKVQQR